MKKTPSRFSRCLEFTLKWEGGVSDHADDPGGSTKFGISQAAYPELDIAELTLDDATGIYRHDFWNRARCHLLDPPVDLAVFDLAVNSGVPRAVRILQRAAGTKADGDFGPNTLLAVHRHPGPELAWRVLEGRVEFLTRLVRRRPASLAFLHGWMRRTHDLARELALDVKETK